MKKYKLLLIAIAVLANPLLGMAADKKAPEKKLSKLVDPTVQGENCVRDTKDMRLNHMNYILHQRKETTQLGKRWPKNVLKNNYSIELCINCHARKKVDNKIVPVSIKDNTHFCSQCHRKVSVNIDCFSCHNSKPTGKIKFIKSPPKTAQEKQTK